MKKTFDIKEKVDIFFFGWNIMVLSTTEEEFLRLFGRLNQDFRDHLKLLEYVNNTWIAKYKEKFIACWTDMIMHFENTSTNMYAFTISCKFQKHNYDIILLTSSILTYSLSYLLRDESAHAKLKRYLGSSL